MDVLLVLLVSFIVLRGVGWLGVERLSSWREAGRGALVIMFLVTSTAHFSGMKHDLAAMIPDPLPDGLWVIYLTGVFEIAGAIGLLVPRTRRIAAICLVLLMVALFPANAYAALNGIPLGGEAPTPLWLRAPMQLLFIGMLWWTSIKERPEEVGPPSAEDPAVIPMSYPREGPQRRETMNFQIRKQRREEMLREARNALARRFCSASPERRGAVRASSLVWEPKRGAGRLCKQRKPTRNRGGVG